MTWLQRRPGDGAAIARLAGEDPFFEDGVRAGLEGEDLVRAEIRLEVSEQVRGQGKTREQIVWNGLSAEIPKHGAEFVLLVEADPVIDGEEFAGLFLEEDVTALAVGVVDEQVEEDDGLEEQFFLGREIKVVIVGVVRDELLERACAVRPLLAQRREGNEVKAERLADEVGGNFAQGEGVLLEIPKRLFAARGFIDGGIFLVFVCDFDEKSVVRAKRELPLDLKVAVLETRLVRDGDLSSFAGRQV
jgi:hypothetical protein